ncbi:hypothetical protein B0O99DRAFT_625075 [Bisporella sp. PMI_857]|nr:hypothetical protein B0O99DRAFT_625075 [Bisporella sp. PMI_857]
MASSDDNLDISSLSIGRLGDIKLAVTRNNRRVMLKADSFALCTASPVWNKFINPPFGEQAQELDFTEDNIDALMILLHIAHLQFNKLPSYPLRHDLILHLANACDQYDCVKLVRPWLDRWLAEAKEKNFKPGRENWLYIAWVFGREEEFKILSQRLVRDVAVDAEGNYLNKAGARLAEPMPPGIIESISNIRRKAIVQLLTLPYNVVLEYEKCLHSLDQFCVRRDSPSLLEETTNCGTLTYGSIIASLRRSRLYPFKISRNGDESWDSAFKSDKDISLSVSSLGDIIQSLGEKGTARNLGYASSGYNHISCPLMSGATSIKSFPDKVKSILSSLESPVLDSHRRHMQVARTL